MHELCRVEVGVIGETLKIIASCLLICSGSQNLELLFRMMSCTKYLIIFISCNSLQDIPRFCLLRQAKTSIIHKNPLLQDAEDEENIWERPLPRYVRWGLNNAPGNKGPTRQPFFLQEARLLGFGNSELKTLNERGSGNECINQEGPHDSQI